MNGKIEVVCKGTKGEESKRNGKIEVVCKGTKGQLGVFIGLVGLGFIIFSSQPDMFDL